MGHFAIKVGLHGLHFSWLTFIYIIDSQIITFVFSLYSGFTRKPTI